MPGPQLRISHLSKTYANGVRALDDLSLTIPSGMFGLLGPNGAGKSSLMRTLATLQEPDRGSIHLGDLDVLADRHALRKTLGYLPQEFGVHPDVSAESLLDYCAALKGVVESRQRARLVDVLLRKVNLWEVRRKKLGGYSGGMRQRFGIAVALIGDPQLLIVDEPTAGLDPEERVRFLNLLSELGEQSVVILSTHLVEDVAELCTRMAVIQRGRILLEAEPLRAVEALRGSVWRTAVDRTELPALERSFDVLTTRMRAGRTLVDVRCEVRPNPSFEAVEPDLEHVYFSVLGDAATTEAEVRS